VEYRQLAPPADLAVYVECAWLLRGSLGPPGQLILPDGRLELVFHLGELPANGNVRQPPVLIAGRMVEALELHAHGPVQAVGVRLRAAAAGSVVPAHLLGPVEPMDGVLGAWATRTRDRLGNGGLATLWPCLRELMRESAAPDPVAAESVHCIEARHGRGPVEQFVVPGIGVRQWERRFTRATGFAPKAFARIARLQHVIGLYESGQRRWAALALEAGFYDQAHLTNEFRSFTGQSPQAYFHAGRGMTEFYRDGFFQDDRRDTS
jgi:hypothetical protein